jgi:integrase
MQLEAYDNKNSYRLFLSKQERDDLMGVLDTIGGKDAAAIAAYSGARRNEVRHARYKDIRRSDAGYYKLRIYEDGAKRSEYREAPIPRWLAERIRAGQRDPDEDIVEVTMRTIDNRLGEAAEQLAAEDEAWEHLSMHDLRRTAINAWLDDDVGAIMCMQWSGHDDWRTFRDHYLSNYSEVKQAEVLEDVDW